MSTSVKHQEPVTFTFDDDGSVPNNRALPFVIYRKVIDLASTPDPAQAIEKVFAANGWGKMWRNGIYPYVHYHSSTHEGMGIAKGRAKVRFGGNTGEEIELNPGDVAILPAGTGHQCLGASPDLMVVGAYPKSGVYDLCRGSKADHAKALKSIPDVPPPDTDPVYGKEGPLIELWRP